MADRLAADFDSPIDPLELMRKLIKMPAFSSLVELLVLLLVGLAIVGAATRAAPVDAPPPPSRSRHDSPAVETLDPQPGAAENPPTVSQDEPQLDSHSTTDVTGSPEVTPVASEADHQAPPPSHEPADSGPLDATNHQPPSTNHQPSSTTNDFAAQVKQRDATARRRPEYAGPREFFEAVEVDDSQFERFFDDRPIVSDEYETLLMLLVRLEDFRRRDIQRWAIDEFTWAQLEDDPAKWRGQIFPLAGRARRIEATKTLDRQVELWDTAYFFRVEVDPAGYPPPGGPPLVVYARRLPDTWTQGQTIRDGASWTLDEPTSFYGFFLKRGSPGEQQPLVFATSHFARRPEKVGPGVHEGHVLLSKLGMDVGLLDSIVHGKPLLREEAEPFYQMLAAVSRVEADELAEESQRLLKIRQEQLPERIEALKVDLAGFQGSDDERGQLSNRLKALKAEQEQAAAGRWSIFPLFLYAQEQGPRLVTLEGHVRRVARIPVDNPHAAAGEVPEPLARFGIDHYYEIFLYNKESQGNPIVFVVRELPEGMPVGDDVSEHVRLTGFFLKRWAYRTREGGKTQPAPLLVGKVLAWYPAENDPYRFFRGNLAAFFAGGLFLVAIGGFWIAVWMYHRGDRQFDETTLARQYSLPEGKSLDELNLAADEKPDFTKLP